MTEARTELKPVVVAYDVVIPNWHMMDKNKRHLLAKYLEERDIEWDLIDKRMIKVDRPRFSLSPETVSGLIYTATMLVILTLMGVFILQAVQQIRLQMDHENDVRLCDVGMSSQHLDKPAECYALADWDEINRGHDIDCVCFGGGVQYSFLIP